VEGSESDSGELGMSLILRRGLKMMSKAPKEPLVVVIGSTGTGKSKVTTSNLLL